MLKVMWAHDHKFYKHGNKYYSEVEFPFEMWKRYLNHFDELVITTRIIESKKLQDKDNMNLSSGERVSFLSVPINNSIKSLLVDNKNAQEIIVREMLECDALIARLPSRIGSLAVKVARKLNKPYAVELVGCPWDALINLPSWKSKLYAPYMYNITKKIIKGSPYTLYVTKDFLQKRYPTSGHQIACSNVNLIPLNEKRERPSIDKNKLINIGLIGYLSPYKGIDTAIKAISLLKRDYPNIRLNILGGGEREYWLSLAKEYEVLDSLEIQTLPSGQPVNDWIDQQQIYIQPSRTEGLPRGLIEAMNRSCPAIASNAGGIPELIDNQLLHTPGDFKKLAELIDRLINDSGLYAGQSLINFEKTKKYSKNNLARKREIFWGDFKNFVQMNKI